MPTMQDRAQQALVKQALEPEWEARFEPNSYGFRPGRSCQDAMEAIFNAIRYKPKFVYDADIKGCFDNINQEALLEKMHTYPIMRHTIKNLSENLTFSNGLSGQAESMSLEARRLLKADQRIGQPEKGEEAP